MILTDYLKFEKLQGGKSKTRLDYNTTAPNTYEPFEGHRNPKGQLFFYAGENYTKAGKDKKSDIALSGRGGHITSLYSGDITKPFAIGDFKGTADALVFVFNNAKYVNGGFIEGSVIEVFVARGYAKNRNSLYNLLADGELEEEMQVLRERASATETKIY